MSIDERVPAFLAISAGFLRGAYECGGRGAVFHTSHVLSRCMCAGVCSSNGAREMDERARRCDEPGDPG